MSRSRTAGCAVGCMLVLLTIPAHGRSLKAFTVAEEIRIAQFQDPSEGAMTSPDGRFIALPPAERGLLNQDRVEDELRIYSVPTLREFVLHPHQSQAPAPVVDLRESTYKDGPIISQARWLPDSSGLAFLLKDAQGENRLVLFRLMLHGLHVLSRKGQNVTSFDVRDSTHYAYTVFSPGSVLSQAKGREWTSVVGTGQALLDLLSPSEELARDKGEAFEDGLRSVLWAASGGLPHLVLSRETSHPIVINPMGGRWLALSPDGETLATAITLAAVPQRWVRVYRPPPGRSILGMRAGDQNLDVTVDEGTLVSGYVLINVKTGTVSPTDNAPTGNANGWWWEEGAPEWSADGNAVLLPNSYLQSRGSRDSVAQPCAAIFYPATRRMECIRRLSPPYTDKSGPGHGSALIGPLRFVGRGSDRVVALRYVGGAMAPKEEEYVHTLRGQWQLASGGEHLISGGACSVPM